MEANGSVYEKNVLRENAVFRKKNGALERTRTFTPFGHNHLKVACLPIPPLAKVYTINDLSNSFRSPNGCKKGPLTVR